LSIASICPKSAIREQAPYDKIQGDPGFGYISSDITLFGFLNVYDKIITSGGGNLKIFQQPVI